MSTQRGGRPIAVFRVVLADPDTTDAILQDILDEQRALAAASPGMAPLTALVGRRAPCEDLQQAGAIPRPYVAGNGPASTIIAAAHHRTRIQLSNGEFNDRQPQPPKPSPENWPSSQVLAQSSTPAPGG